MGRYDPVSLASFRIDNDKQAVPRHPDHDNAFLALILSVIEQFDSKGIAEYPASLFKTDTVLFQV